MQPDHTEENNPGSARPNITHREITALRLKKAAVTAALDLRLPRMLRSPERCARSLMELGISAYPDKLTKDEQFKLIHELILLCKNRDIIKAREVFIASFLSQFLVFLL